MFSECSNKDWDNANWALKKTDASSHIDYNCTNVSPTKKLGWVGKGKPQGREGEERRTKPVSLGKNTFPRFHSCYIKDDIPMWRWKLRWGSCCPFGSIVRWGLNLIWTWTETELFMTHVPWRVSAAKFWSAHQSHLMWDSVSRRKRSNSCFVKRSIEALRARGRGSHMKKWRCSLQNLN